MSNVEQIRGYVGVPPPDPKKDIFVDKKKFDEELNKKVQAGSETEKQDKEKKKHIAKTSAPEEDEKAVSGLVTPQVEVSFSAHMEEDKGPGILDASKTSRVVSSSGTTTAPLGAFDEDLSHVKEDFISTGKNVYSTPAPAAANKSVKKSMGPLKAPAPPPPVTPPAAPPSPAIEAPAPPPPVAPPVVEAAAPPPPAAEEETPSQAPAAAQPPPPPVTPQAPTSPGGTPLQYDFGQEPDQVGTPQISQSDNASTDESTTAPAAAQTNTTDQQASPRKVKTTAVKDTSLMGTAAPKKESFTEKRFKKKIEKVKAAEQTTQTPAALKSSEATTTPSKISSPQATKEPSGVQITAPKETLVQPSEATAPKKAIPKPSQTVTPKEAILQPSQTTPIPKEGTLQPSQTATSKEALLQPSQTVTPTPSQMPLPLPGQVLPRQVLPSSVVGAPVSVEKGKAGAPAAVQGVSSSKALRSVQQTGESDLQPGNKKKQDAEAIEAAQGTIEPTGQVPLMGVAPVASTAPTPYSTLSPQLRELFDKMVGMITVQSQTGVTTTTVTVNMPNSPLQGVQIVLQQFDTARHSFNIQLEGTPEQLNFLSSNVSDLAAAFAGGKYAFSANILPPQLISKSPHLIKRKEAGGEKGEKQ